MFVPPFSTLCRILGLVRGTEHVTEGMRLCREGIRRPRRLVRVFLGGGVVEKIESNGVGGIRSSHSCLLPFFDFVQDSGVS